MGLIVAIVAGGVVGQPKDGDLIVNMAAQSRSPSFTAFIDPTNPTALTTIAIAGNGESHSAVRMAANNVDLMLAWNSGPGSGQLRSMSPSGTYGATWNLGIDIGGFRLDHDGTWIAVSCLSVPNGCWDQLMLLGLSMKAPIAYASVFVDNHCSTGHTQWDDVVIDRDPGASEYAVTSYHSSEGGSNCGLLMINRKSGITASSGFGGRNVGPSLQVELDPQTGDYLHFLGDVLRTDKSGAFKARYRITRFAALRGRITQDHNLWITGWVDSLGSVAITEFDLVRNIAIRTIKLNLPSLGLVTGIEIYGSRRLVCNQQSSTVAVEVQSRRAGDGGKSYALACSFNRRPLSPSKCLQFPNGEYLFLDYTDNLFWTSFLDIAPTVFQNFKGVLDSKGNATSQVNIPSTLPPNLGITIFVAGVIYDATGVRTVTNTHWFVLP